MECYNCGTKMDEKCWVNKDGEKVGKPFFECPKCGVKF